MSEENLEELSHLCNKMNDIWHFSLRGANLYAVTSFITFKRVNDLIPDNYGFPKIREKFTWEYLCGARDKVKTFQNAAEGINYDNYSYVPYGDDLIPTRRLLFPSGGEREILNNITLVKWCRLLNDFKMSQEEISDDEWLWIMRDLRGYFRIRRT